MKEIDIEIFSDLLSWSSAKQRIVIKKSNNFNNKEEAIIYHMTTILLLIKEKLNIEPENLIISSEEEDIPLLINYRLWAKATFFKVMTTFFPDYKRIPLILFSADKPEVSLLVRVHNSLYQKNQKYKINYILIETLMKEKEEFVKDSKAFLKPKSEVSDNLKDESLAPLASLPLDVIASCLIEGIKKKMFVDITRIRLGSTLELRDVDSMRCLKMFIGGIASVYGDSVPEVMVSKFVTTTEELASEYSDRVYWHKLRHRALLLKNGNYKNDFDKLINYLKQTKGL